MNAFKEKKVLYEGLKIRMVSDSTAMLEARRQCGVNIFTVLRENSTQYGILCPADIHT